MEPIGLGEIIGIRLKSSIFVKQIPPIGGKKWNMTMPDREMKKEYDFSVGVRGRFYRPDVKLNIPVYLDEDALAFVQAIAKRKKTDISSVVNELIRTDKHLADVIH